MAKREGFSSEDYVEKLKEKEIDKQRDEERQEALEKNSYLKDPLVSDIIKKPAEGEEEKEKEFSSEEYYEKLKEKAIKDQEN